MKPGLCLARAGKGTGRHVSQLEFSSRDPHGGRRADTLRLTSACAACGDSERPRTHTKSINADVSFVKTQCSSKDQKGKDELLTDRQNKAGAWVAAEGSHGRHCLLQLEKKEAEGTCHTRVRLWVQYHKDPPGEGRQGSRDASTRPQAGQWLTTLFLPSTLPV